MVPGVIEQTTEEEPTWCPKQTKAHAAPIQQKHMRQRNKGSACCHEANKTNTCGNAMATRPETGFMSAVIVTPKSVPTLVPFGPAMLILITLSKSFFC